MNLRISVFLLLIIGTATPLFSQDRERRDNPETVAQRDERMQWWREARFGLFIHWGLYAIPAGAWDGKTEYGEWIRERARIPLTEYDKFVGQFNPTRFNATDWVRMAKDAGMKYIVITSKHHDGFSLFDSKETEFDVLGTPFKRDILKELAEACQKEGIILCFYHSIMDWHHPDYLPRRDWEKGTRSAEGADFNRYVDYMKRQLKELLTNYGAIGVLWFDGEWEPTWTSAYGIDLYNYVRGLRPSVIVNNRVGAVLAGMAGITKEGEFGGDFGTPEQEIPATGLPGLDWETCMTMNTHWGYNKNDHNWKSGQDLIRMLVDIASKGGNFLLNVGPTAEGLFPDASIDRLKQIGDWMKVNGESIYGTRASPFRQLSWGRSTQKSIRGGTRMYLHVFQWPVDGNLVVPGLLNSPTKAFFLADPQRRSISVTKKEDGLVLALGSNPQDPVNTVVVLDVKGSPEVAAAPDITSEHTIFLNFMDVSFSSETRNTEIRYTLDGAVPSARSSLAKGAVRLEGTTTVSARLFRAGKPISPVNRVTLMKVAGRPADHPQEISVGLSYAYYEGEWNTLPDFNTLQPLSRGSIANFDLSPRKEEEHFGFDFRGYIRVPVDGVYTFYCESDDGSRVYVGDLAVADNDGRHAMLERKGIIPLSAGLHPIRVIYFEQMGGQGLRVSYSGPGVEKQQIPDSVLFHRQ